MSNKKLTFSFEIPTDEGFLGRECNDSDCGKYFKVHEDSLKEEMYCPYCAKSFHKEDLLTKDQTEYAEEVAKEKAEQWAYEEFSKMLKKTFKNSSFINYKSGKRRKKNIKPKYKEKKTDSEFTCPYCDCNFQVYGIFGYCPGCKKENILIYDANVNLILKEIENSSNKERALRHAYADIVSTFEIFCKQKAQKITTRTTKFQDLYEARRFFKKNLDVDILEELSNEEELTFKRIFQKRHLYDHSNGIISDRYVQKIPEDNKKLGEKAELGIGEFETGSQVIRKVLSKIINKIH